MQNNDMATNISYLNTQQSNPMTELSHRIENDMDKRQPQIDPNQLQQLQLQQQLLQQQMQQRMQQGMMLQQPKLLMPDKGSFLGFTSEMFKETAVVAVLFILFSLSYVTGLLGTYLPIMASGEDGSTSIVTIGARAVLVGGLYLFIKRFFIVD